MSSLIVEVSEIQALTPHPNAERLELAQIKGWQCVVPKGKYRAGELVVYVPPGAVLPDALAEQLGVAKYLSKGRVRCARLRGEPSFGLVMDRDEDWPAGTDVAGRFGITKYVPPPRSAIGEAMADEPLFVTYTDVENLRNFPTAFANGEAVVVTEKIHGTNCRVGLVRPDGAESHELMCGSKQVRRAVPANGDFAASLYAFPLSVTGVRSLLEDFAQASSQIVLFGEVYGKVQSLKYDAPGRLAFRAFDLYVDGRYVDADTFAAACATHGVPRVSEVYRGPFALDVVRQLSDGPSTVPGADNIREGVVVRPVAERTDPKLGRVVLKYVGDTYLFGTDISDTDER